MPTRARGEKLSDYVGRCIMARRKEHPEESQEQSVAACYSMGRKWWKAGKKKETKR